MGNCCATTKFKDISKIISTKLAEAIEKNAVDRIREIILDYALPTNKEPMFNINQSIVKILGYDMNALGFALFKGYTESFAVILELGKAKISAMTKLFLNINKRPIDIICELGHHQLLEFYLPFYMIKGEEIEESESNSISLSISRSKNTKSHINERSKILQPVITTLPLHRACEKGKMNIIRFCWEYFQNKTVPKEFDIHYQDDYSGDNCALVSCKTGNLEVIKYLHEVCKADFHIFNKRKESAIQVLAV